MKYLRKKPNNHASGETAAAIVGQLPAGTKTSTSNTNASSFG